MHKVLRAYSYKSVRTTSTASETYPSSSAHYTTSYLMLLLLTTLGCKEYPVFVENARPSTACISYTGECDKTANSSLREITSSKRSTPSASLATMSIEDTVPGRSTDKSWDFDVITPRYQINQITCTVARTPLCLLRTSLISLPFDTASINTAKSFFQFIPASFFLA